MMKNKRARALNTVSEARFCILFCILFVVLVLVSLDLG